MCLAVFDKKLVLKNTFEFQAFVAQQMKVVETRQKLRLSDMQIEALKMDIRRCELTDREMAVSVFIF